MKILVVMLYWYPYEGPLMPIYGTIFQELMKNGHQITIVTSFPHFRKGRLETWEEYRGKLYEVIGWEGARLIRSYVYAPIFGQHGSGLIYRAMNFISFNISSFFAGIFLAGKADVILAPSTPPLTNGVICWLVSKFKRCPVIYNVQDLYPDMAAKMGLIKNRYVLKILNLIEKLVYRLSDKVLTISEGMRDIITQKGVPAEKIEVIENFLDTELINPGSQDNAFSRENGLVESFVIMYAGNIGIPHGVEVLIGAAEILKNEPGIVFCFVARGENKEAVQSMARSKGLMNTIFIEPQAEEMVPLVWATASAGVITYRKGLADFSVPSKLLAMMAAARPVVASVDMDSVTARLITKSNCGLCILPESPDDLAEAFLFLKKHPKTAESMGKNGRKYMEQHLDRRKISAMYETLFLSVTEKKNRC